MRSFLILKLKGIANIIPKLSDNNNNNPQLSKFMTRKFKNDSWTHELEVNAIL